MKRLRITRRQFYGVLFGVPAAVAGEAVGVEPGWLRVKRIRMSESPVCRFVHFTDVHHRGDAAYLTKVIEAINEQKPDFVCFTGDLIEEAHFAPEALAIFRKLKAPLYGIPGNHDHWADLDFDLPRVTCAETGGQWLMNEDVVIHGGKVHLFGLSAAQNYPFTPTRGHKNILLSHYPSGVKDFPNTRFDLVLAGHSHGGQVRIPGYGAIVIPAGVGEYDLGMYQTPAGPLYVNPGIGYFFANVRFFCRPEITVFEV
jgi:predicted MPP superfamily phosphohydrolase